MMNALQNTRVSDLNVASNLPLPAPALLCHEIERTEEQENFIADSRKQINDIIFGEDSRLLIILGPCSIHCTEAGKEYAEKLINLSAKVSDKLLLVMRVYFEKPRTTVGWKGLIMDPKLDGSDNIAEGLRVARTFLSDLINLGIPTATELLDPITPQYIADLISWSAIGARTTESQTHRQMASGLSMPLGFKNATNGSVIPAINAIKAAMSPQTFLGISPEGIASAVSTNGNPHCHVILRGGEHGPNYEKNHVNEAVAKLKDNGLHPAIMIDASHDNSQKDHNNQPTVFRNIVDQRLDGDSTIIGAMLESNLVAGNQEFPQELVSLIYGQSITDKCIDWETTEKLIFEAAEKL